jgi:hypothetical protein
VTKEEISDAKNILVNTVLIKTVSRRAADTKMFNWVLLLDFRQGPRFSSAL